LSKKAGFGHAQRLAERQNGIVNVTSAAALRLGYELKDEQAPESFFIVSLSCHTFLSQFFIPIFYRTFIVHRLNRVPMARQRTAFPIIALSLALSIALASPVQADGGTRSGTEASTDIHAKETFAIVWERLQNSGFSGKHEGLDWAALKTKHQPDIENAKNIEGLRREINELLTDLKASHLVLLPAETVANTESLTADATAAESDNAVETKQDDDDTDTRAANIETPKSDAPFGDFGLRLAMIEGLLRVERVADGSPAQRAGIRPGWTLERIGKFNTLDAAKAIRKLPQDAVRKGETMLAAQTLGYLEAQAPSERVKLRFRDASGKTHAHTLASAASANVQSITLPGIPPMPLRYNQRVVPLRGGGCALHVEFSLWAMPVYDSLMQSLRDHGDCKGVVIDLRGNSGGLMASISAVGGLFFDERASLGTLSTGGGDLKLTAVPRVVDNAGNDIRRFSGPVAILIDGASISCSDMFPAGMQALQRARIFGVASAGMALPAASTPLPSGDRLLYPIADFVDPAGRRIEGIGTIPDQIVAPTVAELTTGRDPILDAALTWFGTSPKVNVIAPKPAPASTSTTSN
jgi:carboxyl-terminal processing protease